MFRSRVLALATVLTTIGGMALADGWTLNNEASRLAFGSVKKNTVGEVHSFTKLAGTVAADGSVSIQIDLTSVETLVDIRNDRMREFVFKKAPTAQINASIDMGALSTLPIGDSAVVDVAGTLSLGGASREIDTEMFILRVSAGQVLVTTNDMIMLSIADMGLNDGIDTLMALAKLPSITRVSPVTLRLVFDLDSDQAAAAPTITEPVAEVALAGDAEKGKKVFRKCKACHSRQEGKNAVGPTLHNVLGRQVGSSEGFSYSKALTDAEITWTPDNLGQYLADPKGFLPGNKMSFRGLRKQADIDNLIAYLATSD